MFEDRTQGRVFEERTQGRVFEDRTQGRVFEERMLGLSLNLFQGLSSCKCWSRTAVTMGGLICFEKLTKTGELQV